ncbi:hypothetical protein FGO68_gene16857 [Halteria grandinella]|uniref:Uncharacterized protein n=1 Tax=Halteria grandinella TaxID=5974 RepID=A0A8J8T0J9_HALGN|nr:hypothetical protein FGO68_gene16857 [Halteria grandinella]
MTALISFIKVSRSCSTLGFTDKDYVHLNFQIIPFLRRRSKSRSSCTFFLLSDRNNYKRVCIFLREFQSTRTTDINEVSMVGVKDGSERQIQYEEAYSFADSVGIRYMEIDIVSGYNIHQLVIYTVNETLRQEQIKQISSRKQFMKIQFAPIFFMFYLVFIAINGLLAMQMPNKMNGLREQLCYIFFAALTVFLILRSSVNFIDHSHYIQQVFGTVPYLTILTVPTLYCLGFGTYQMVRDFQNGQELRSHVLLAIYLGTSLALSCIIMRKET